LNCEIFEMVKYMVHHTFKSYGKYLNLGYILKHLKSLKYLFQMVKSLKKCETLEIRKYLNCETLQIVTSYLNLENIHNT
jgi:hypothetical protein